jgi:ketosteroid isomerase-like protein
MSRTNVEIVAQFFADFGSELSGDAASDFVWDMSNATGWPDAPVYHGHGGFSEFFDAWAGAFDEWEQEVEAMEAVGGSRVVVVARQRGRLKGSDSWTEMRYGVVYTLAGGMMRKAEVYSPAEDALAAVGLSPGSSGS